MVRALAQWVATPYLEMAPGRPADAVQRFLERIPRWNFDNVIQLQEEPGDMLPSNAKTHVWKMLAWARQPPADLTPAPAEVALSGAS